MSSPESANKALVRRYVEAIWNCGQLDAMADYVADDYVFVPPDDTPPIHGPEGLQRHVATLRDTLQGLQMKVGLMLADGDYVVWTWTMTGRHAGHALGPPTGRDVTTRGVAIYRIADGRIIERDGEADVLGLFQQLGLLPALT